MMIKKTNTLPKLTVVLTASIVLTQFINLAHAFEAACLLVPATITIPANIACGGSGGACYKPIGLGMLGCSGDDCVNCCLGSKYECGTVTLTQNYSCCRRIPDPPTDTCTITNDPTTGVSFLEVDCSTSKVCPATGSGTCVTCATDYPGVCYKTGDGPLTNGCCNGYMCPEIVNGVTPCISGNVEMYKLLKTISGMLLPLGIILGMILIIGNGYKLMTSQGDPTKLQEGKDGLTSAIIGLLFILMAVSILRVIIKALITGDTDPFS